MKFGERLKNARLDMDLTQENVANELLITRQTISSWENEKTYPDISSLIKLNYKKQKQISNFLLGICFLLLYRQCN